MMFRFAMTYSEHKELLPGMDCQGYLSVRPYKTKQIDCMTS